MRTLDNEFADDLKFFLNKEKYRNIIVKYDILVQNSIKESNVYHTSSNASSSIPESYTVARAIEVFLNKRKTEMSEFIPSNLHVVFNILFSLKQSKEEYKNNDYGQSKQSELPYYSPIKPRYNFNQIILSDSIRQQIKEAICIINNKDLIYKTWGFSEVDSIPKSILNFYGPPGTGKTMCAHAIAHELGKKLLALNYSEIESKFVGDAPKNLQRAFEIATEEDCVLFFDEADSFLGKRIQSVNQSADQALNSLRSQMLILLEEHSGVVIFATNLVSNFDKAFQSRILKHIKFELPNEEARISIIRKMIPGKLPLTGPLVDSELKELGEMTEPSKELTPEFKREKGRLTVLLVLFCTVLLKTIFFVTASIAPPIIKQSVKAVHIPQPRRMGISKLKPYTSAEMKAIIKSSIVNNFFIASSSFAIYVFVRIYHQFGLLL